jgi:hypothetical protein
LDIRETKRQETRWNCIEQMRIYIIIVLCQILLESNLKWQGMYRIGEDEDSKQRSFYA